MSQKYLILTYFHLETQVVLKSMNKVNKVSNFHYECEFNDKDFSVVLLGQSGSKAVENLRIFFEQNESYDKISSIGYCGGLNPEMKNGEVYQAKTVYSSSSDQQYEKLLQKSLLEKMDLECLDSDKFKIVSLLTCKSPVDTVLKKNNLWTQFAIDTIDMETFEVEKYLNTLGKSLSVIKCIMDDASTDIHSVTKNHIQSYESFFILRIKEYLSVF